MKQYKVKWDYISGGFREDEKFNLKEGDTVQLDDEAVAWLERDQAGLLEEVVDKPKAKPKRRAAKKPPKDRQVKASNNRSAQSEITKADFKAVKDKG